LISTSIWSKI